MMDGLDGAWIIGAVFLGIIANRDNGLKALVAKVFNRFRI